MSVDTTYNESSQPTRNPENAGPVANTRCISSSSTHRRIPRPRTELEPRGPQLDYIFHRRGRQVPEKIRIITLAHAVSRAVFEVLAGYRTVQQLNFVMNVESINKLQRQALLETHGYTLCPAPGTSHGQVRSMRLRCTLSGAWECTVILGFKHRVRAVALRIEPWHGRWQVTSVETL